MTIKIPSCPYVYTLSDPDGVVFYIGKGRNKRIYQHEMNAKRGKPGEKNERIRSILESGGKIQYQIISIHKTDIEACLAEIEAIAAHDNLTNKTKGGEAGASPEICRTYAIRKAKNMLSRLIPFDRWVAGMSEERKQYLIKIAGGESLREQWDWIESCLRREAADPSPDWVATGPDGKAQFGYGRAPEIITLGKLKYSYQGKAPAWHSQRGRNQNG